MPDASAAVFAYHERSKHRLDRYAPGPGGLDWRNQPNPFREFAGAPRTPLVLAADGLPTGYEALRRGELPSPSPMDAARVGVLFELSLALSAWKSHGGSRWALRCNPSSGNLHPTEGYLVCGALEGIPAGVHHYVSRDHALEARARRDDPAWDAAFAARGFLVGLTSIHWREAWKYGLRAWRYCQHDCGHAVAAVSYAAAALGWQARIVAGASDEDIARLLGLDRADDFDGAGHEAPDVLLWVGDADSIPAVKTLARAVEGAAWAGRANRLSPAQVAWPDIPRVEAATRKDTTTLEAAAVRTVRAAPAPVRDLPFARLARQRRSAVDFDGETGISRQAFASMLACLMPSGDAPPWSALGTPPQVHPAFMVHRVDGLEPGLYVLLRDEAALDDLRKSMRAEFLWERVDAAGLPLHLLFPHDLRPVARTICCHQDIGADSCFALGMLACTDGVREHPWKYRELYWECGMLGHVLYLEAEAAGVRATGIGCFFDDEMHRLLGLSGPRWQSLYHLAVGGPVEDGRLLTLPPYG